MEVEFRQLVVVAKPRRVGVFIPILDAEVSGTVVSAVAVAVAGENGKLVIEVSVAEVGVYIV